VLQHAGRSNPLDASCRSLLPINGNSHACLRLVASVFF
jgi:hypothetical protein